MATPVAAAIIRRMGQVLIAQRGPEDDLALKWEFPGGKIEAGETPEACLVREIKEEFNILIMVDSYFCDSRYTSPQGEIHLLSYFASFSSGEVKAAVHSDYKWVYLEELDQFDFAPADIAIVEKLKREFDSF